MTKPENIFLDGILSKDRVVLAKAITLIESSVEKDQLTAENLLSQILPHAGNSFRLAVTGTPGAGKSTLIEKLGLYLIDMGHKVAVLAIDPSSSKSGGSILGDKTRMENLSQSDNAFIRPSPSLGASGGVTGKTRESILLCEAAGYDIIIVETVGVGQGELAVHNMVDFFLLLQIAGAGDELQGMKKGIVEIADAIVINKADGDNIKHAEQAQREIKMAMHYLTSSSDWEVPVLKCSAMENKGIDKIWEIVSRFIESQKSDNTFYKKRSQQNREWMLNLVQKHIEDLFYSDKDVKKAIKNLQEKVLNDEILATNAANKIINIFKERYKL